jgi:hypothetical protein
MRYVGTIELVCTPRPDKSMASNKTTQSHTGGGHTRHWGEQPHRRLTAREDNLPMDAMVAPEPTVALEGSAAQDGASHVSDSIALLGTGDGATGCGVRSTLAPTSRRQRKQTSKGTSTAGATNNAAVHATITAGALASASGE